jgi:hypothetical protein
MNPGDAISFGSLIVTIISTFILPLLQAPILGYLISDPEPLDLAQENILQSKIKINNYGTSPAKHVVGSMSADNTTFLNFTVNPFLSKQFKDNTNSSNQTTQGFFEIEVLPPGSETIVTATMNISNDTGQPLMIDIRSDEIVGHINWLANLVIASYISFLVGSIIIFIFIFRKKY